MDNKGFFITVKLTIGVVAVLIFGMVAVIGVNETRLGNLFGLINETSKRVDDANVRIDNVINDVSDVKDDAKTARYLSEKLWEAYKLEKPWFAKKAEKIVNDNNNKKDSTKNDSLKNIE